MKPVVHVFSEDLIRDATTNSVSLVNVIEEINGIGFPVFVPKLSILLVIEKEAEDADISKGQFKLFNNENELFCTDITYSFEGKTRTRNHIKVDGIAISAPGTFTSKFLKENGAIVSEKIVTVNAIYKPEIK